MVAKWLVTNRLTLRNVLATLVVGCGLAGCWLMPRPEINPLAIEHNTFCAEYYQQGLLNEAESRCQLAIEFAPTYAEPHNLLGLIAHARGQRPVAMEFFKKALSYKDDFAEKVTTRCLNTSIKPTEDFGKAYKINQMITISQDDEMEM